MITISMIIIMLFSEGISSDQFAIDIGANEVSHLSGMSVLFFNTSELNQQYSPPNSELPEGSIGYILLQTEGKIKDAPNALASVQVIVPKGSWIPIYEEKHNDYIKVQYGKTAGYLSIIYVDKTNLPEKIRIFLEVPKYVNQPVVTNPVLSRSLKSNKNPSISHMGLEWNVFWNWGDCELLGDYENFGNQGKELVSVDKTFLDTDFSVQFTLKNRIMMRYTYAVINDNIDGPVGPDLAYQYGDRNSADWDWEETTFEYDRSGSQNISHIFSIGYPLKIADIDLSEYGLSGSWPFTVIPFIGIAFANNSIMDEYVRQSGFSDWYFMDEIDWYIENRVIDKSIKPSFGISIPLGVQTSLLFTGTDWRLMFGIGI